MQKDGEIWKLVGKKLMNEASEEDLRTLDDLLKQQPEMQSVLPIIFEWWKINNAAIEIESSTQLFNKIKAQITP